MKTLIKALNDQKNRLMSNTHFSREDFETIVFSEEDLVEKYLKENDLSENDVNLEELRDMQRVVVDALETATKKIMSQGY